MEGAGVGVDRDSGIGEGEAVGRAAANPRRRVMTAAVV